ncbi:hypothetical protein KIPB_010682, partial [Kipferlia bialata]
WTEQANAAPLIKGIESYGAYTVGEKVHLIGGQERHHYTFSVSEGWAKSPHPLPLHTSDYTTALPIGSHVLIFAGDGEWGVWVSDPISGMYGGELAELEAESGGYFCHGAACEIAPETVLLHCDGGEDEDGRDTFILTVDTDALQAKCTISTAGPSAKRRQ